MALPALIAACVAMLLAALGAGNIPISAASAGAFSSAGDAGPAQRFALVSSAGAGLLVSTAVSVVVPEAFHALMAIELAGNHDAHGHDGHGHDDHGHDGHAHAHGGHVSHAVPDWAPGAALLAGVALMQALDMLGGGNGGPSGGCGSALGGGAGTAHASDGEDGGPPRPGGRPYAPPPDRALPSSSARPGGGGRPPYPSPAALLPSIFTPGDPASAALAAMIVHALADGLAVGAACVGGSAAAEWLVLGAMVAHKAPGALGLAALLVSARWPTGRARAGLALFAAASPLGAVLTYGALAAAGAASAGPAAALALLFSGGTLLHAALGHVLPAAGRAARLAGEGGGGGGWGGSRGLAMAGGAAVPLLLSALAPHGH
jgi:hypothetical protein